MAVPDYQSIMLPLLKFSSDGLEHSIQDAVKALAIKFELSEEDKRTMLPSGRQATFNNRVGWAKTYMTKAGLMVTTRRSHFKITERGLEVISQKPASIDGAFLSQFPEFIAFKTKTNVVKTANVATEAAEETDDDEQTPEESIEKAYGQIRNDLASSLIDTVKDCSPSFFERLVVDLVVKMGYGGTRFEAGQAIGGSGDEGIDGIINEDRLGLDVIYIQAKRWQNTVTRPEIQKFAGALLGKNAKKGIFITTSDFSKGAREFAFKIDSNIVLIDGSQLAELMIDYNVGVNVFNAYEIKRIDSDYFEEG